MMKKTKKIQDGSKVYIVWFNAIQRVTVSYSYFDRGIGERTYITVGVCFVQSDIGKNVFLSEEEAKKRLRERWIAMIKRYSNNRKVHYRGFPKIKEAR